MFYEKIPPKGLRRRRRRRETRLEGGRGKKGGRGGEGGLEAWGTSLTDLI